MAAISKRAARRILQSRSVLFQRIDGQAAEQLGIEVRRLLREHFAGKSDVPNLRHSRRIHKKRQIGLATANRGHSFADIADIAHILLVADRLLRDSKHAFQQTLMKLHDVERLLAERKVAERGGRRFWPAE